MVWITPGIINLQISNGIIVPDRDLVGDQHDISPSRTVVAFKDCSELGKGQVPESAVDSSLHLSGPVWRIGLNDLDGVFNQRFYLVDTAVVAAAVSKG